MVSGIGFGERIPNFVRMNAGGQPVMFYDRCCGDPALIVTGTPATLSASAGPLAQLLVEAAAAGLVCFVVVRTGPDGPKTDTPETDSPETGIAALSSLFPDTVCLLADSDGQLSDHLAGRQTDVTLFITGRTLRLLASLPFDGADPAIRRTFAKALAYPHGQPPLLEIPDLLTPAECDMLIGVFDRADPVPSGSHVEKAGKVVLEEDPDAKVRLDVTVPQGPVSEKLMAIMTHRLVPELRYVFSFTPRSSEQFKIVRYDADSGGHFAVHRDNSTPDAVARRFAITLNLNTGAYDGGGLIFPEYGPAPVSPPAGGAVVFSCGLAHRVTPVTRGVRYALISFLHGA